MPGLREIGAWLLGPLGVAGLTGLFDPLIQFLLANAGTLFGAVALYSGTLNPEIGWVPTEIMSWIVIGAGLWYFGVLVRRLIIRARGRGRAD